MNSLYKSISYRYRESPTPLRIADILSIGDDEDEGGGDLTLMDGNRRADGCLRTVSRWLSGLRREKVKKIPEQADEKEEDVNIGSSVNGPDLGDLLSRGPQNDASERCRREESFNVGVGCCLLYLMAASKNELDKMIEMRKQTETFLQIAKQNLKMKDFLPEPSETDDIFAYSHTDAPEGPVSDRGLSPTKITPPYAFPDFSAYMMCDPFMEFDAPKPEERFQGMDRLEAELEEELERLQLRLDQEKLSQHSKMPRIKVPGALCHLISTAINTFASEKLTRTKMTLFHQYIRLVTAKDAGSTSSHSWSSGEVIDPVTETQEACSEGLSGFSPYELERKLHGVLEARQQEQIQELEAALECAKRKLHQKEIEISWWKDTARIFSQHVPASSRHVSDCDRETYRILR